MDVLKKVIDDLNKVYGEGTVNRIKDFGNSLNIKRISSGSLVVDNLLGGGFPKGRIIEVYGLESSGKTTLAIHAISEVQKNGGKAAMIDMEHAFDKFYAENLGVDVDELVLSQPMYGEQALDILERLIVSGEMDLVVIDSVSALIPKRQLDGEFGDANVGIQAKMMSMGLPKIVTKAGKYGCTVIFINQIRMKVGVIYGSPEVTSGGNALKFYASQRIDIRKKGVIKSDDGNAIANEIKVKVVKNKVAPPFTEGMTQIRYGSGIYKVGEVLILAEHFGIIERNGAWYYYQGEQLAQGQAKMLVLLEDNIELLDEIELLVKEKMIDR